MFKLEGKSAVITGGGSGIGRAISKLFSKAGAKVFVLDFSEESASECVDEIHSEGGVATFFRCDVANQQEVSGTIQRILQSGSVDILVNNAGVAHVGNLENTAEEDLDRLYQVNIKGVYNCARACMEHFRTAKKGVILNMASIASSVGILDRFAYSMTKGAVLTMTYSIAKDYLADGVRCNCISPARIHTPFVDGFVAKNYPDNKEEMFDKLSKSQPIGRMGTPEEVAYLALYLCSDEASFITGTDYPLDGGFIKLNN